MKFEKAMKLMRKGHSVAREVWLKDCFLGMRPADGVVMHTNGNWCNDWQPVPADISAKDWLVVRIIKLPHIDNIPPREAPTTHIPKAERPTPRSIPRMEEDSRAFTSSDPRNSLGATD